VKLIIGDAQLVRCEDGKMRGRHVPGVLAALSMLVGCSSGSGSSTTGADDIHGTWVFEQSAAQGKGLTLNTDGTFTASVLVQTGATSLEAAIEKGTFTADSNMVTLTPTQATCPGPDPVQTFNYSFVGGNLEVSDSTGIIEFMRDTASPSASIQLEYGCFGTPACTGCSAPFTAEALAPVSN
jgi:hypothetical protein